LRRFGRVDYGGSQAGGAAHPEGIEVMVAVSLALPPPGAPGGRLRPPALRAGALEAPACGVGRARRRPRWGCSSG